MSRLAVSFCNAAHTQGRVLGILDCNTGALSYPDLGRTDIISACGLAVDAQTLYCACSVPEGAMLMLLERNSCTLRSTIALPSVSDIHSIALTQGGVIAVSTGTDQILAIEFATMKTTVLWNASTEMIDTQHLNAVVYFDQHLLCSGFGEKQSDRWSSANDGYIYDITSSKFLVGGLYHPHSLTSFAGRLYVAESSYAQLRTLEERVAHFDGYVRGVAFSPTGACAVGTSIGRYDSTIESIVLNPADPGSGTGRCAVYITDEVNSWDKATIVECGAHANEIYDLVFM